MLAAVVTFLAAIGINIISSLHSISDIKINEKIKTFSINVSADTSIDIGTKKIEDVFFSVLKKYLENLNLKENKTNADLELTFKIDNSTIKDILGLENKKMEVDIKGTFSLKNNISPENNCENESFSEKIEIDYKNKEKKEENVKVLIEKYVENFVRNKLAEKD